VDGLGAAPRDDARRAAVGADDAARAAQADGRHARGAERGAQIDVQLAGDDHLHDVERGLVGDAAAAYDLGLEAQALRQLGRLGTAAVDHDEAAARRARGRDLRGDDAERGRREHVAAQLDDGRRHGQGPGSSRDIVSGRPNMRFMFWMAWPAPPLIRLSVALTIASVRLPVAASTSPSVKPTSAMLLPATAATS